MDHEAKVKIYGIRHHGAGSTRNLLDALTSFQPEIILIECPADCQDLITYVQDDFLVPPVAILAYDKQDPQKCAYYPFTIFSPEWQAMIYGFKAQAEIRFFDLPQSQSFLLSDAKKVKPVEEGWVHDPFSYMADLAGYDDPERWWDTYIEQQGSAPEIFEYINQLMAEMRLAGFQRIAILIFEQSESYQGYDFG